MRFARLASTALATVTLLVATASPALAQGHPTGPDDGWKVTLGALGTYAPDYEGSDDYEFGGFPAFDITYSDWFFLNRDGIGANVVRTGPLSLAVGVGYEGGREANDNVALTGLGDVDGTAEAKLIATWQVRRLSLSAKVSADALGEGHDGVTAEFSAAYVFTPVRGVTVIAGPAVTWADNDYMDSYFSTPASSGYGAYNPSSGFKDVGVSAIAITELTDRWSLMSIIGAKRLLGDAADSGIVDVTGSRNQAFTALGVTYRF